MCSSFLLVPQVQTGQAETVQALSLIQAMREEDNYTVWSNIATCLEKIHNVLINTDYVHLYDRYGLGLMESIFKKLGYEIRSDESGLGRTDGSEEEVT